MCVLQERKRVRVADRNLEGTGKHRRREAEREGKAITREEKSRKGKREESGRKYTETKHEIGKE
jgi:hypothetical protein